MITKTGIAFLQQIFNPEGNFSNLNNSIEELDLKVIPARVTAIVLDESHPNFNTYGGWTSIGTINFEFINETEASDKNNPIARPFFNQFKNPPLVNEIVLLLYLPDKNKGTSDTSKIYYYLNAISIWNHPHHNAYPNVYEYGSDKSNKNDYQAILGGVIKKTKNNSKSIDLNGPNNTGGNFEEKSNIRPLITFTGDNIFEGRFGNSIRLGSTVKSTSLFRNNWSEFNNEGDPIIILRNTRALSSEDTGFIPTVENINSDDSSIYLTTTQNLPISASSTNYTAISEDQTPEFPGTYSKPQAILNSGRILLNSTDDSILLSSKKIIALSSLKDIGLSSRESITLSAESINLGGTNASQPAVLGDTFLKSLKSLTSALQSLANAINNDPKVAPTTQFAGNILNEQVKKFNEQYDNFTSKSVKLN